MRSGPYFRDSIRWHLGRVRLLLCMARGHYLDWRVGPDDKVRSENCRTCERRRMARKVYDFRLLMLAGVTIGAKRFMLSPRRRT